jgi:hypothetical protein
MITDRRIYGNEVNPDALKSIKDINEKLQKETDPEERMHLLLQRMNKGFEMNGGILGRPYRGYYPY